MLESLAICASKHSKVLSRDSGWLEDDSGSNGVVEQGAIFKLEDNRHRPMREWRRTTCQKTALATESQEEVNTRTTSEGAKELGPMKCP